MDNLPTCVSISESLHTGDKQTLGEPTAMSKQLWRPPTVRPPKSSFHSQNGEDELFYDVYLNLTEPLHEPPVFVEVGALDGWTYSNSHVFEVEMGWRAVLIEAQPNCWPELERNRPNASIVREAVCADGPKQIHILSAWTIRADNPGCHAFGHVVGCRSLGVMLREANVTRVEAMSVDIEGGELDALSSMDWTIPVHWLIIEMSGHDHQKEAALRSVLELRKFTLRDTQRGSEWFQSTVWPQPAVTPFGPPKD